MPLHHNSSMNKEELLQVVIGKLRGAMQRDPNLDTQAKVAAKAGISQGHVSKLLLGEAAPTTDTLAGLAKALKCMPFELLVDDDAIRREVIERALRSGDHAPTPSPQNVHQIRSGRRTKKG
jgi:DNA-binding phage protein